jgi:hypothetical protein
MVVSARTRRAGQTLSQTPILVSRVPEGIIREIIQGGLIITIKFIAMRKHSKARAQNTVTLISRRLKGGL